MATEFAQPIALRVATPDDEPFLFDLFASTRMDEFGLLNASPEQIAALVRMQYDIRRAQYEESYPRAESQIIMRDAEPIGRILINEDERELALVDIAVLPEHRNAGVGTHFIRELLSRADRAHKPVRLQVLKTSPARRLYERLGFAMVADQSMYLEMKREPME